LFVFSLITSKSIILREYTHQVPSKYACVDSSSVLDFPNTTRFSRFPRAGSVIDLLLRLSI
jgi:hypothetical protein